MKKLVKSRKNKDEILMYMRIISDNPVNKKEKLDILKGNILFAF